MNNPSQTHTNVTVAMDHRHTDDLTGFEGAAGVDGSVVSSANSLASNHSTDKERLFIELLERDVEDSEEDTNSFSDLIK